ncbi:MAG: ABC transporter permease [Ilumatobacter sp.]|uniref:ABC transporter permease n=1 Tax=Ilumatobacter sp. TaxID=1967498 RepID=UPI00391B565C
MSLQDHVDSERAATDDAAAVADQSSATPGRLRRMARAWSQSPWELKGGVCLLLFLVLLSTVGAMLYGVNPQAISRDTLVSPSWDYPLGTDTLGRDVLARVMFGMRYSLAVAFFATIATTVIGVAIGTLIGYVGGSVDWIGMRLVDVLLAIPALLIAVALVAALGPGLLPLTIILVGAYLPQTIRVVRASTLQVRSRDFVNSARLSGLGLWKILVRHMVPNIRATVIVQASVTAAYVLLIEAALSFLGLGLQPPTPSLGFMVTEGRARMEMAPMPVFAPGTVILLAVSSFMLLGQGLDKWLLQDR